MSVSQLLTEIFNKFLEDVGNNLEELLKIKIMAIIKLFMDL